MLSLERRFADLVRKYERLNEIRKKDVKTKRELRQHIKILGAECALLERSLAEREKAAKNTMSDLLAVVKWASARLAEHGDDEGSEKLLAWHETMSRNMQPVADVKLLVELLSSWMDSERLASRIDGQSWSAHRDDLKNRTENELRKLTGSYE